MINLKLMFSRLFSDSNLLFPVKQRYFEGVYISMSTKINPIKMRRVLGSYQGIVYFK